MKIKLDFIKKVQKSNLIGYGQVNLTSKEIESLIGKKCEITGEIEIREV